MRKVLYTKFSRERRNEFQIMTRITEEDGIRRVWKLPLQKEGELHIRHPNCLPVLTIIVPTFL